MKHEKALDRILSYLINDPLSIVSIVYFLSVIGNLNLISISFNAIIAKNSFFPDYVTGLKVTFPFLFLGVLVFIRLKIAYFIGLIISFILLIHPSVFGAAEIVIGFYLFLWLFAKDKNYSIFFGRLLISFIFLGATIGKLTPGWLSGEQLNNFAHLRKIPSASTVIIGEFLMAISFLLPFHIASLISIFILTGMTLIMHNANITVATFPMLGMVLTFLSIASIKKNELKLYFHEDQKVSNALYHIFNIFKINNIILIKLKNDTIEENTKKIQIKKDYIIQSQNENNELLYGFDCFAEIVSRTALLAFLFPLLIKLKDYNFFRL